ncbi:MAG: domain S-box protein [Candidatus Saccharibacteria bacterium]|nr:domain S-box protein [Candidatus Saccharibacteria bacterium]
MADTRDLDYERLFMATPGNYVIIGADVPTFTILAASDGYLKVTGKERAEIIGKPMFEVFPDTSPRAQKTGKGEVQLSFERCIESKQLEHTGVIRYDILSPGGKLSVRYWQATHYPIINDGTVTAIMQSTDDITEDIFAQDRLQLAELQLDQVLADGLIGSYIWDIQKDAVVADKGLAYMFGIEESVAREGLPLKTFTDAIYHDDRKRVEQSIADSIKGNGRFMREYRTTNAKGQVRWVIARGRVDYDANKRPLRLAGLLIDITERKESEAALVRSEERLRFMADAMPQLVWIALGDGTIEYYNHRWFEFTGVDMMDRAATSKAQIIHPDDRPEVERSWKKALNSSEPYEYEYRIKNHKTNSYYWFVARAEPYKDANGNVIRWYGTSTNIDEQKRTTQIQTFLAKASKELSSSLEYKKTVDSVGKLVVPELADWYTLNLYDEAKGWEEISVVHKDAKKLSYAKKYRSLNPTHIDAPTGLGKVVRTGEPEFYPRIDPDEYKGLISDDAYQLLKTLNIRSFIIAPITIGSKPVGGITFVSSDSGRYYTDRDFEMAQELARRISLTMTNTTLFEASQEEVKQRRQLEKELRKATRELEARVKERTKQLQETNQGLYEEIARRQEIEDELQTYSKSLQLSNQELQDFAYVASHDLQEPLRKIQAFGNLLESEYARELGDGADYLHRMHNAASRMSVLIQDLLAFSRVTTKAKDSEWVDMNRIVKEVLGDLEMRIEETDTKVTVTKLPKLLSDPTHMRQLMQNLISNAIKFRTPDQAPVIKISAKHDTQAHTYTFFVQDNGIGFDIKYLDRIFSVFQRLHGRDAYEGTGIGLAVCRKIVERYGGTITADSKPGHGATFIVTLPDNKEKKA